jgi:phosphate transport system substrate-binding protein
MGGKMRRTIVLLSVLAAMLIGIVGCASTGETTPQVVKETVEVVKEVEKQVTVVVEKVVEVEKETAPAGSVQLTGAGASFPYPLYSRWFYEYAFVNPVPRINYQSIGSGGGIRQITEKNVDFAGSDAILNEEQRAAAPGLMMLPTVAGAVVLAYNVQDPAGEPIPTGLKLTPEAISAIFLGQIVKWNDPVLVELNPEATLPDLDITVAHRSDGSGTSFIFTSYLSAVSDEWQSRVGSGTAVEWPVGLGGKGNEGVAGIVKEQPGSVGYVELAYATQNKLPYAYVANQEGLYIEPGVASTTAASNADVANMPEDLGQVLANAPGADSYTISGYTFLLVYQDMPDCEKALQVQSLIRWAMTDEADALAIELQYAPLGDAVKAMVLERVDGMTCNGGQAIAP